MPSPTWSEPAARKPKRSYTGMAWPVSERPRLCIENATAAYGAITARAGLVRYHVIPGQTECKPLVSSGSVTLRASTIGGGAAGPLRYATTLHPSGFRCWRWRLTDAPASATDLGPCPSEPEEVADDTTSADSAATGIDTES